MIEPLDGPRHRTTDLPLDPAWATFARNDIAAARLSSLEVAAAMVYGRDPHPIVPPPTPRWLSPRAALEHAVAVALSRPPCAVSFSGGRDSSAVLALAALVARRDGHPLPIPVTLRFADAASRETDWQEQLVSHLELTDWVRLHPGTDLDLVGDLAMQVLRPHGVQWPFNAHFHLPIAQQVRGGSVLTGIGGDEVLTMSPPWNRVNQVLARRVRPSVRDVARLAMAFGPRPFKAALTQRSHVPIERPWLTVDAQRRLEDLRFARRVDSSFAWGRATAQSTRSRYVRIASESLALVGRVGGARLVVHPFFSPVFLASVARHRRFGFANRADALHDLVGDLLPTGFAERTTKATFNRAFWGPESARFAAAWDGTGLDPAVVDIDALQRCWREPLPPALTYSLLQAARVASLRSP